MSKTRSSLGCGQQFITEVWFSDAVWGGNSEQTCTSKCIYLFNTSLLAALCYAHVWSGEEPEAYLESAPAALFWKRLNHKTPAFLEVLQLNQYLQTYVNPPTAVKVFFWGNYLLLSPLTAQSPRSPPSLLWKLAPRCVVFTYNVITSQCDTNEN